MCLLEKEIKPSVRAANGCDSPELFFEKKSKATSEPDSRHSPTRSLIQELHLSKFGVRVQWDGSEARALNKLLASNPSWTQAHLDQMVRNRFASEINGERPRSWLPRVGAYVAGPLDRFGQIKPKPAGALGLQNYNISLEEV